MIFCANELKYHTFEKTTLWYPKKQQKQQKQHLSKNAYFGEIAKKLIFLVKKVSKPI